MAHRFKLVILALAAVAGSANAGYAQLAPPAGFGGSPAGWTFAPSANDATFGRVIHQPNALKVPVPGSAATMPASYRLAANAPRFAAAAIFAHPYVRTGVAIAAWLLAAKLFWDEASKTWRQADTSYPQSDGYEWTFGNGAIGWHGTRDGACQALIQQFISNGAAAGWDYSDMTGSVSGDSCIRLRAGQTTAYQLTSRASGNCPVGWYVTPAGCVQTPQPKTLTEEEFKDALAPKPMPEKVPLELPKPTPLPIEQPSPWINPAPVPNPSHRPLFVPTGNPVPNPNYDPNAAPGPNNQPYMQPGVRIVPSPTINEPWRVDVQPVNRPAQTPEPLPNPQPEPVPDPENPDNPDNSDKPKPEEQQSLCEKHPDIVACARLGDAPEAKPVPNENKEMTITPDSGWGEGSGSCPAPKTVQVHGFQLSMPFDLLCQFATGIRPVVIGLAWLAAAFTFMGLGRRE